MAAIIGKGGSTKAKLAKDYGVKIDISSEEVEGCFVCEIEGAEKDCLKVKELIVELGGEVVFRIGFHSRDPKVMQPSLIYHIFFMAV